MNIKLEKNGYLILTPFKLNKEKNSSSIIIIKADTDCLGKIAADYHRDGLKYDKDEIVMFDVSKSKKYVIDDKEYIIVTVSEIIARVEV